ncbi:MAG: GNAT family N-acetyltransferase, partial [Coriobacteriia bacterium]|nr:GNAT family N-acetyltransferase [Coriobacteriia bacterium]
VLGDAGKDRFVAAVAACIADDAVNGILLFYTPQGNARPDEMAHAVSELVATTDKPVITVLMGGETVQAGRKIFSEAGIPCYETPEDAVKTYLGMYRYSANLDLLYETPAELSVDVAPPRHNLEAMLKRIAKSGRLVLTEEESKRFLTTYGIPVVRQQTTHSVAEALEAAADIGYPVVLKIVSHEITHKNAVGGVEVGICSEHDLERSYAQLLERVKMRAPDATIEGVAVQKMVRHVDYELILGMKKDEQFGSVIVFGAGGVGAEGLADFSVSLPPLNPVLARRMVEETRVFRSLSRPPRGVEPTDLAALDGMLTMLSNLVVDFPEIAEIDVNPVVVANGEPVAVDARIIIDESVLAGSPATPHLVITPYPTRYVAPWKMSDGTDVLLRPIKPEDEHMIAEMLETMTERSLHDRFFDGIPVFDHDRLVRFTNNDYEREIAMVAELTGEAGTKRLIGVGRLLTDPERPEGEFTVIVHDDFHGKGLGFKLVDLMIGIAEDRGLERLRARFAPDNERMLELAADLGFSAGQVTDGVVPVTLELG